MSSQAASDVVRRYIDAINRRDFEAAAALLDEDIVIHGVWRWPGTVYRGLDGWHSVMKQTGMSYRRVHLELEIREAGQRILASGSALLDEGGKQITRDCAFLFTVGERGIRRIDTFRDEARARAALADGKPRLLTAREREIFRLLAMGLNGPEIAGRLNLSANTVRTHVANGMAALQAKTRAQAVAEAISRGEFEP